jgi:hypothetical protein
MNVHDKPDLNDEQREGIMGTYLTMKNKNYFGQIKEEVELMRQQKEDE